MVPTVLHYKNCGIMIGAAVTTTIVQHVVTTIVYDGNTRMLPFPGKILLLATVLNILYRLV